MPHRLFSVRHAGWGAVVLIVILAHCANPVPPTGGPRDETPPSLVASRPAGDAVNVPTDTRTVRLAFSEYVDRASLAQSLTVTPALDGRLAFDWSGPEVAIELPETLRDSTTYIFTFDTTLSDTRGVGLDEPLVIAFSTGPRISRGTLAGRIVSPGQGTPQPRVDVYAYALGSDATEPPLPLPERPTYRTQSGDDGAFRFEYLREQDYFVVAVRDVNRNRQADASERRAAPPRFRVPARADAAPINAPWVLAPLDTTAPRVQRVRPLSSQRLEVRFSEPVRLDTLRLGRWALRDSVAETPVALDALYTPPNAGPVVRLRTGPMRPEQRHRLQIPPGVVRDTLGQALPDTTIGFFAADAPDTLQTRFRGFRPPLDAPDSTGAYPLLPNARPGVRFNQPPDSSLLQRVVRLRDTTGTRQPFALRTRDGITFRVVHEGAFAPGTFADVAVRQRPLTGRDTVLTRRYRRVTRRALGDLEGDVLLPDPISERAPASADSVVTDSVVADSVVTDSIAADTLAADAPAADSLASDADVADPPRAVVEAYPVDAVLPMDVRRTTVVPGSTFVMRSFPEGTFRFRAFLDRDGDERWSAGTLTPYVPPEPITWSDAPTDSRPRWTNVLPAPLRFPTVDVAAPSSAPDSAAVSDSTATPVE